MDINTFRAMSVVLVALAFAGVCWWAFSPSRKQRFKDAAELPFAEDTDQKQKLEKQQQE